jgi:DNA invertase Pin-like site-specific DNA recombinase
VDLGYARVSTVKQDLDRQVEALAEAGIARERIYVDKGFRPQVCEIQR